MTTWGPARGMRCNCKGAACRGRHYICTTCRRFTPWCVGGTNEGDDDRCDACWYAKEARS